MKKRMLFLLVIAVVFACNKDEDRYDNYRKSLGVLEIINEESNEFQINLDNGNILIPDGSYGDLSDYVNDDRVFAYYSEISSITEPDGNKLITTSIHFLDNILTKNVIVITDENADSIGNNRIHVHEEDIWLSQNFLNIYFSFYGGSTTHFLNLVKYPNDSTDADGRLILELRHNANNDHNGYAYDGLVSFNMNSLQQPNVDSLPFVVKVYDYYEDYILWKGTYYFDKQVISTRIIEDQNLNIPVE